MQFHDALLSEAGGLHATGAEENPSGERCTCSKGSGGEREHCSD